MKVNSENMSQSRECMEMEGIMIYMPEQTAEE